MTHVHVAPATTETVEAPRRRRRGVRGHPYLLTFVLVLTGLTALRLALPSLLEKWVHRQMRSAEGYGGGVEDIDVNLWRGAYEIENFVVDKLEDDFDEPLFEVQRMELSVDWSQLSHGLVVGEIDLLRPVLQIVSSKDPQRAQTGTDVDWTDPIDGLFPFRISRLTVREGVIHYHDLDADPQIDVWFEDLWAEAHDLSNPSGAESDEARGLIEAACRPLGTGQMVGRMEFDPIARPLRFELDVALRQIDLTKINDLLIGWGGFDVERGSVDVFIELAAQDGRVQGYIKLLVEDLAVFRFNEIDDPGEALDAVWDLLVGGAAEVLENQPNDRLAMRIAIDGTLDDPKAGLWTTIRSVLENAFVSALDPGIEPEDGRGDLPEEGGGTEARREEARR